MLISNVGVALSLSVLLLFLILTNATGIWTYSSAVGSFNNTTIQSIPYGSFDKYYLGTQANQNFVAKIGLPSKGVYESALTDFGGEENQVTAQKINDFQNMIGKKIVWAYFSNNRGSEGIKFPESAVKTIHSHGIVPFIRMMPRSTFTDGVPDPVYTLQAIIDGKFDSSLKKWADDAKIVGFPIMVEFGTEVNGDWFPWSGILNGGAKTTGYGDPTYPDGPERFRDAYRHIIDLFRKEGVRNITWSFHVYPPQETGQRSALHESWNSLKNYYPGDDYIDWIGVSVYGSFERQSQWKPFSEILDGVYPELSSISRVKPLAILEFGVLEDPQQGNKSEWIKNALLSIESGRYPRIKAISYWDERWNDCTVACLPGINGDIDLRLNSSPKIAEIYKKIISSPFFISEAQVTFYNR